MHVVNVTRNPAYKSPPESSQLRDPERLGARKVMVLIWLCQRSPPRRLPVFVCLFSEQLTPATADSRLLLFLVFLVAGNVAPLIPTNRTPSACLLVGWAPSSLSSHSVSSCAELNSEDCQLQPPAGLRVCHLRDEECGSWRVSPAAAASKKGAK